MSIKPGVLYIVATPIGNLEDLGPRAQRLLREVNVIAAEDTRHTQKLLARFDIHTRMVSCHEHNEESALGSLLELIKAGGDIALVADAGTPLISDPGLRLVRRAHDEGIRVVPIPGPSALTSALSVCGLPVDAFVFAGFLPEGRGVRQRRLQDLAVETRTMVFFESPHRITAMLKDCMDVFGPDREAATAREMTKKFESIRRDTLAGLLRRVERGEEPARGELVVIVHGADPATLVANMPERERIVRVLLHYLSVKDAASAAAAICGSGRKELYEMALRLRDAGDDGT